MSDNNSSRAQAWGPELMNRNTAALNGSGIGEGVGAFVSRVQSLAAIAPFGNLIVGTNGNDTLSAEGEGDLVFGRGGDDTLSSNFNRTALFGGRGGDTLSTNDADTLILVAGEDTIDLAALATANIHAFADLAIETAGNDGIIRFDADNSITILDNTALNGGDFLFA